jgi:N-acetylglutamate synthase-like GNAT family acetyltransferase
MKGQRLFVRPIEESDAVLVRDFLSRNGMQSEPPRCGLMGKLVGELVAVLAMELDGDEVRIEHLIVDAELRRKRIGRVMLSELAALAAKMDRRWLVASNAEGREFFSRVGFVDDGHAMRRRVGTDEFRTQTAE